MKINRVLAFALVGAMAMTGCVSIDSTRAKLNSKDAVEVKEGEDIIYQIATEGRDSTGFVHFTPEERIEYVKIASNNELLLKIIDRRGCNADVVVAAIERLDFSMKGSAYSFIKQRSEKFSIEWPYRAPQCQNALRQYVLSKLDQNELMNLREDVFDELHDSLIDRLIEITDSPRILLDIKHGEIYANDDSKDKARQKLLAILDKVMDAKMVEELLSEKSDLDYFVKDADKRLLLMKKLPESQMVELALKGIKENPSEYNVVEWERKWDFKTATQVALCAKERKSKVRLVATILSKLYDIRQISIDGPMFTWAPQEEAAMSQIIKQLPKLSESETGAALCLAGNGWHLLIDSISPVMAKRILSKGKVAREDIETALAEKISPEGIDMAVYQAVKSEKAKKVLGVKMPESVKQDIKAVEENAFAALLAKAKEAAKSTFELDGFYLGMTMEDAKSVFLHHFPDGSVNVSKDGYALYVSGQRDPLCRIYSDTKVVYQLNFGKAMLKKWYKYDAGTIMAWAEAYAKNHGVKMELEFLERNGEVYAPNGMLEMIPYSVSLHQETYQSKNAMNNYRLTYFGERKIRAFSGGMAARALAEDKYSVISASEGTLRAQIEND